ncbi:pilus assembly protein CpaE [Dactylosporangium sp. CA-139066]|uniref:pilus assembly protein CpaE n=1 Tax=Dactylosporangium sp. CA-139066 TaxID=3239930 RepID=UPI003D8CC0D6
MISIELAGELRDAGLDWRPRPGDRFAIPDRGLDDQTFVLSDMIAQVHELPFGSTVIGFNGTTEWALDDVERDEAIWLPREDQLRDLLGGGFRRLERAGDGWRVTVDGQADTFGAGPEDAYALALLRRLKERE